MLDALRFSLTRRLSYSHTRRADTMRLAKTSEWKSGEFAVRSGHIIRMVSSSYFIRDEVYAMCSVFDCLQLTRGVATKRCVG